MAIPYRPDPITQIDGSALEDVNCVPATVASLIDRATMGRIRVTATEVRTATGDTVGVISYGQALDAAIKVTNGQVVLQARYGVRRGDVRALLAGGHALGISMACSVTVSTAYATGTYKGPHTQVLGDYEWREEGLCQCAGEKNPHAHAELLNEDPGTRRAGWRFVPADLFYRAAEARNGGAPGSASINVIVARDTEDVDRTAIAGGKIRATTSTKATSLGPIPVGQVVHVARTLNGGNWTRDDGTKGTGWGELATGGFIRGGALR